MTNNEQLRIAAIEKLRAAGVSIHEDSKIPTIASAIEKLHGRQMAAFKPLTLDPVLAMNFSRASQHQKTMMTPNGVGNGAERVHGYGRGM